MKVASASVMIGISALAGGMLSTPAEVIDESPIVSLQEIDLARGSRSTPPALEAGVLYGDPNKEGWFVLKLKLPANYTISPYTHFHPEAIIVRSGTLHIGMGKTVDRDQARPLPAGSYMAFPPGAAHFAFTEEETVIQLNSTGPWALDYVYTKDEQRPQLEVTND